jgi:hypothetical protein
MNYVLNTLKDVLHVVKLALGDAGFDTLKDVLDVVIVPIVIFGLPSIFEAGKRRRFLKLIRRELREMKPEPSEKVEKWEWPDHLNKRFIHAEIFTHTSENRDFILSLPKKLAYEEAQLWSHAEKYGSQTLAEHGASWCDYLWNVCKYFDRRNLWSLCKFVFRKPGTLHEKVYKPWETLILSYHPALKEGEHPRLTPRYR